MALFHKLIISLAIWDISVLIMITGCYILPTLSIKYYQNIFNPYYPYGLPIVQISVTGSIYSTLFLTIERYVCTGGKIREKYAMKSWNHFSPKLYFFQFQKSNTMIFYFFLRYIKVCKPFLHFRKNITASHFIIPGFIFSLLYNLPYFFELEQNIINEYNCFDGKGLYYIKSCTNGYSKCEVKSNGHDGPLPSIRESNLENYNYQNIDQQNCSLYNTKYGFPHDTPLRLDHIYVIVSPDHTSLRA